jgi:hypothetical protein
MKLKAALFLTVMLTVMASALAVTSAQARVTVGFDFGNVGAAYSDGYYDRGHHWHHWRHHRDMDRFRSEHADMYHEWRHNDRRHHDDDR